MHLFFAGLARNCEQDLPTNVDKLLEIGAHPAVTAFRIYIAENDSNDQTRNILRRYSETSNDIELVLLDNLDDDFPVREKRIAHCRDLLLSQIKNYASDAAISRDAVYVPVDLDSQIASSVIVDEFIHECSRVVDGSLDAVFPNAKPFYYDIYALRAPNWVEEDCWAQVNRAKLHSGSFFAAKRYVYSKQRRAEELSGLLKVDSAFGGLGIYKLNKVLHAKYLVDELLESDKDSICEHVIFNRTIGAKVISSYFTVSAPFEHIRYNAGSFGEKMTIALRSFLSDGKSATRRGAKKIRAYFSGSHPYSLRRDADDS